LAYFLRSPAKPSGLRHHSMSWLPGTTSTGVVARSRVMNPRAAWNSPWRARWLRSPEITTAPASIVGRNVSSASI